MKIPNDWTIEKTHGRLKSAHGQENELNKQLADIDKQFRVLSIKKAKVCKLISKNMKYRNTLIKML